MNLAPYASVMSYSYRILLKLTNPQQFSMVYTLIDRKMMSKIFKTQVLEPQALGHKKCIFIRACRSLMKQ